MKGTMIQLISKGSEDTHLTITPEFSYFKTVYKRHTNFSMEAIETIIVSTPTFGSTKKIKILREGELLSKVYLEINLPYHASSNAVWTNRIGFNLIKKVELISSYIILTNIEKQDMINLSKKGELEYLVETIRNTNNDPVNTTSFNTNINLEDQLLLKINKKNIIIFSIQKFNFKKKTFD